MSANLTNKELLPTPESPKKSNIVKNILIEKLCYDVKTVVTLRWPNPAQGIQVHTSTYDSWTVQSYVETHTHL